MTLMWSLWCRCLANVVSGDYRAGPWRYSCVALHLRSLISHCYMDQVRLTTWFGNGHCRCKTCSSCSSRNCSAILFWLLPHVHLLELSLGCLHERAEATFLGCGLPCRCQWVDNLANLSDKFGLLLLWCPRSPSCSLLALFFCICIVCWWGFR